MTIEWPQLITAGLAFVVWLVRLESAVQQAKKDIDKWESKHDDIISKLEVMNTSLNRIEGKLNIK